MTASADTCRTLRRQLRLQQTLTDIYDVVCRFEFLQGSDTIFRGQFDIRWGLDSSLLRLEPDGTPLSVKRSRMCLLSPKRFSRSYENGSKRFSGRAPTRIRCSQREQGQAQGANPVESSRKSTPRTRANASHLPVPSIWRDGTTFDT